MKGTIMVGLIQTSQPMLLILAARVFPTFPRHLLSCPPPLTWRVINDAKG